MRLMSWSLNEPLDGNFNDYAVEIRPGEWEIKDPEAYLDWPVNRKNFWSTFLRHNDKITSFGLQDFGVNKDGEIYDYVYSDDKLLVLDKNETKINRWMRHSLRYLVDHYKHIEWYMQFVGMGASRVDPLLDNKNGEQDTFIRQTKKVVELYMERFPGGITGVEIDFEKSTSRGREQQEAEKYRDLLRRVKNEVCIPNNLKLRVTLHAMTGDFNPNWYSWSDYRTLANGRDKNGKMICDEWQIMSYDFAHGNSAPGPSTPVWWLREVLDHATDVFPPETVWIGNAAYGRRWPLNNNNSGVALTYAEMLQWQNGLNKHNVGFVDDKFTWVDQNYIPFTGFHDDESGYQRTFLHSYDRFEARFAKLNGTYNGSGSAINRGVYNGTDFITSYSKHQRPIFKDIQTIKTKADKLVGNVDVSGSWSPVDTLPGTTFTSYLIRGKSYIPDYDNKVCVLEKDTGSVEYEIKLKNSGRYRLIAAVRFPYLNCELPIKVNNKDYIIGEDIPDWYPLTVNPENHFYDCGEWDLSTDNTIKVGQSTDTAQILGFIVCKDFDHNMSGGTVDYDVDIMPFKRRGKVVNGVVEKVDAKLPKNFTITPELLRRPPRPAIFWEDMFAPYLNDTAITNLAATNYYQRATVTDGGSGTGTIYANGRCVQPDVSVGFSKGEWKPDADATAHAYSDARNTFHQLILYKEVSFNPHIEADLIAMDKGQVGIRFYASKKGTSNNGYLFVADFNNMEYRLINEQDGNKTVLKRVAMSLRTGSQYTYSVRVVGREVRCMVGKTVVLTYDLPNRISKGAHGVYAQNTRIKCKRIHLATNDRYEPMEKISVIVDGEETIYLGESRPYTVDEFGYYVHTGFATNENGIIIDNDYDNFPLKVVPSWEGKKKVTLRMVDAGIWLNRFYVGDSEGYSIAWNGDLHGFMTTSQMVSEYGCKGIAMWTLGQEDPNVFNFLPRT